MTNKLIPHRGKITNEILNDQKVRRNLSKESFYYFFHIYFHHHAQFDTAPFQKEMMQLLENDKEKLLVFVAFRGSAKSTIVSLAYVIWAVLGKQNMKYILLTSQTQVQVRQLLTNIRTELETNGLLKKDFGNLADMGKDWHNQSLVITSYGARISAVSTGESVRGLKHEQYRPQLIICDDVENLESVKTVEQRDKTYQFITGELISAGVLETKIVVVGNLLHYDSVIQRLEKEIINGKRKGVFKEYPLLDSKRNPLWQSRYPTENHIQELQLKIGNELIFQREFMLRIIPDSQQVVHPDWINYYDEIPGHLFNCHQRTATGVDLAISLKDSADYTAMVSASLYQDKNNYYIYILPYPVNERLTFPETVEKVKSISSGLGNGYFTPVYIEQVAYQEALIHQLDNEFVPVEGVPVINDKRTRLSLVSKHIKNGTIQFPKQGCEDLVMQILGFGAEKYDDLMDAFCLVVLKLLKDFPEGDYITSEDFIIHSIYGDDDTPRRGRRRILG